MLVGRNDTAIDTIDFPVELAFSISLDRKRAHNISLWSEEPVSAQLEPLSQFVLVLMNNAG